MNLVMEQDENPNKSFSQVLRDVGSSAKNLFDSELTLIKTEIRQSSEKLGRDLLRLTLFGALLAVSILPFLAFAIIALGEAFSQRYWLSSLTVALLCGGVGGLLTVRSYHQLKNDMGLPATKQTLRDGANTFSDGIKHVLPTPAHTGEQL